VRRPEARLGEAGVGSEVIVKGRDGRPQVRYEGERYFGPDKRQKFLSALTLSCNVKSACAYAAVHFVTAYKVRRRDPEFAAQWREAIELGCERLEALILEHGGAGIPLDTDPASAFSARSRSNAGSGVRPRPGAEGAGRLSQGAVG
jgi:hypothetical protein